MLFMLSISYSTQPAYSKYSVSTRIHPSIRISFYYIQLKSIFLLKSVQLFDSAQVTKQQCANSLGDRTSQVMVFTLDFATHKQCHPTSMPKTICAIHITATLKAGKGNLTMRQRMFNKEIHRFQIVLKSFKIDSKTNL